MRRSRSTDEPMLVAPVGLRLPASLPVVPPDRPGTRRHAVGLPAPDLVRRCTAAARRGAGALPVVTEAPLPARSAGRRVNVFGLRHRSAFGSTTGAVLVLGATSGVLGVAPVAAPTAAPVGTVDARPVRLPQWSGLPDHHTPARTTAEPARAVPRPAAVRVRPTALARPAVSRPALSRPAVAPPAVSRPAVAPARSAVPGPASPAATAVPAPGPAPVPAHRGVPGLAPPVAPSVRLVAAPVPAISPTHGPRHRAVVRPTRPVPPVRVPSPRHAADGASEPARVGAPRPDEYSGGTRPGAATTRAPADQPRHRRVDGRIDDRRLLGSAVHLGLDLR